MPRLEGAHYKYLTNCSRLLSPTSPFIHAHTRTYHQPDSSPPGLAQLACLPCYKKASAYGSRVGWTPARRNNNNNDMLSLTYFWPPVHIGVSHQCYNMYRLDQDGHQTVVSEAQGLKKGDLNPPNVRNLIIKIEVATSANLHTKLRWQLGGEDCSKSNLYFAAYQ